MNIVEIEGLSKQFGTTMALDDVDLNIEQGSISAILGPNGAGKTTLLRIINGILAKDSGTVRILGEDASLKTACKIGYMPEERGLYDSMTIENQIMFFGQLKGASRQSIRQVMKEYLELFNLGGQEKRKLKELSKGNQQKVQIISTIAHQPSLVILDEPFSGFDPINGALLQELIERLHSRGITVVLSSHNMHAVEEMCQNISLINHGKLLISDKIEDIKERNKTGEMLVTTSSPLSTRFIESGDLVEWIKEDECHNGRKGYAYRLLKKDGVSNICLINDIAVQSDVLHFEEALPSLNDIFIKYTLNSQSA